MKRFFTLSLIASLAFGMVSCTKEASVENNSVAGKSFTIFASTPDTKTVVNDEMNGVEWAAGDAMNIFHVVAGSTEYVSDGSFTLTEGTEFSGTVNGELGETNDWYAFYPYTSQIASPENTTGYVVVGSYNNGHQQQNGNNSMKHLAGKYLPLYGSASNVESTDTPSIAMKQAVAVLAINVTNTLDEELTVTSVSFTGTEDIVGKYYIDFSGDAPVFNKTATTDVSNKAELAVSGATALAKGESAKYYIAVKPFVAKSGSKLILAVNGYEKEITLDADVEFTRAKIKTINFSYNKPVEVLPSVDTESEDYLEGFESSFTPGNTYNNSTEKLNGPNGEQWAAYYGTVSTNATIAGANSMQMRWYTSAKDALGYARTNFTLSKVRYISFKAASTNGLKVALYYMNKGAWTLAETFNLSSTATTYEYEFVETLENVQLKFQVALPDNAPTATSNVRIDDVLVSASLPEVVAVTSVSLNKNSLNLEVGKSETLIATVTPSDAANKNVAWESSNTAVATVVNGNVTAVATGEATITVTTEDGAKTASCAVTVIPAEGGTEDSTLTLTYSDIERTSYSTEVANFTKDGISFGYVQAMQNNANGTPTGWAKNQVIQVKKTDTSATSYIGNLTSLGSIKNIRVYLVANTNSFSISYGESASVDGGTVSRPTTVSGTENIAYKSYVDKVTGEGTTIASYYDFDLSEANAGYFRLVNGSGALYIYKIVISYKK